MASVKRVSPEDLVTADTAVPETSSEPALTPPINTLPPLVRFCAVAVVVPCTMAKELLTNALSPEVGGALNDQFDGVNQSWLVLPVQMSSAAAAKWMPARKTPAKKIHWRKAAIGEQLFATRLFE